MPRRAFDLVGGFDPGLARLEDFDWYIRFALAGGRLDVVPDVLATISLGRRARIAPVREAARKILAKAQSEWGLNKRQLARLRAYLALELAAACRNEGRYLAFCGQLLRSFGSAPRWSAHLEPWWS